MTILKVEFITGIPFFKSVIEQTGMSFVQHNADAFKPTACEEHLPNSLFSQLKNTTIQNGEIILRKFTIVTASLLSLSAAPLYAQDTVVPMLDAGTKELALSGMLEFTEFEEVDFDLDVSYGYFFKDGWEVGLRALGSDLSGIERFDFSVFTEYNFNRQSPIVPFLGTSVGVASVSFDGFSDFDSSSTLAPNDGDSTVFSIQGGIKWFIRPYMAISTSIAFNVSTDDIYLADNELKDNLTRFRFGLRYYF